MQHASTTEGGETVGCPSSSGEFSTCRGPSNMISDHRTNANRKVLVKCVGENLLPTAQAW